MRRFTKRWRFSKGKIRDYGARLISPVICHRSRNAVLVGGRELSSANARTARSHIRPCGVNETASEVTPTVRPPTRAARFTQRLMLTVNGRDRNIVGSRKIVPAVFGGRGDFVGEPWQHD